MKDVYGAQASTTPMRLSELNGVEFDFNDGCNAGSIEGVLYCLGKVRNHQTRMYQAAKAADALFDKYRSLKSCIYPWLIVFTNVLEPVASARVHAAVMRLCGNDPLLHYFIEDAARIS